MADSRFSEAEKACDEFLSRFASHPRAGQARAQRAIALSRQNKHTDAVAAINELERTGLSGLDAGLSASVRYEKAWCLREQKRDDEAAAAYRALLDGGVEGELRWHAVLELAGLHFQARRWDEAAKLLRELRESPAPSASGAKGPLREQGLYRLAMCEFQLGRMEEAAPLLDEFVREFPDSSLAASAGYHAGEAYYRLDRFEPCAAAHSRVTERYRDDPVLGPSLLRLGDCLCSLQRWAAAERAFGDYLDRFSSSELWFQARFGLGWARENQRRYAEAVDAYRAVIARHQGPTAARAQFQIGECLLAQERFEEAARELLKVDILYAYPEWSAAAIFEAGRCFERMGKAVEARTQFAQVAEKFSDTRWGEMAARRLAELSSAAVSPRGSQ
jgi:TolA-binding protein